MINESTEFRRTSSKKLLRAAHVAESLLKMGINTPAVVSHSCPSVTASISQ